jgi:hypothetical protein
MASSIQDIGNLQGMARPEFQQRVLTDDQKSKIADILSQYDPENITEEQAKEIFAKFREAGIQPARGMKEAIEGAGFDAENLRSLGMPSGPGEGGGPPPPPPQAQGIDSQGLQLLQSILSKYDLNNLSSDQEKDLLAQLNGAGFMQPGNMIDVSV